MRDENGNQNEPLLRGSATTIIGGKVRCKSMFGWFFQNFLSCQMLRKGAKKFDFCLILVSWHQLLILVLVGVGQHPSFLLYPWHFWTNKLNSFCYDRCRTFSHPLTTTWSCYMSWSNRALHQISLVSESWHFASNSCSCWAPWTLSWPGIKNLRQCHWDKTFFV